MNFGDGTTGGTNSIHDNNGGLGNAQINNASGEEVNAEDNWWGQDPPLDGQFGGANSVDRLNPLSSDPN